MVYTLGHRRSYEAALAEDPQVKKLGRRPSYPGGSVWRTYEEAEAYRLAHGLHDYAVYGVDAEWGVDTAPSASGPWHDLLRDATIVRVSPPAATLGAP